MFRLSLYFPDISLFAFFRVFKNWARPCCVGWPNGRSAWLMLIPHVAGQRSKFSRRLPSHLIVPDLVYSEAMDELELEMRVTRYGPARTHWWPLSVPSHPIAPISSPPSLSTTDPIAEESVAAQSISTYPVFDGGAYV